MISAMKWRNDPLDSEQINSIKQKLFTPGRSFSGAEAFIHAVHIKEFLHTRCLSNLSGESAEERRVLINKQTLTCRFRVDMMKFLRPAKMNRIGASRCEHFQLAVSVVPTFQQEIECAIDSAARI